MLSLPIGCLFYQVSLDGFFIAGKYTGPLLIISEGLLDMNKRKILTGRREPPVLNILGFCRRSLAFNPCPDVFITPSLKVINSIPLLSFAKQKSSIFISWCCWCPRNPKCWINSQKTVFIKDLMKLSIYSDFTRQNLWISAILQWEKKTTNLNQNKKFPPRRAQILYFDWLKILSLLNWPITEIFQLWPSFESEIAWVLRNCLWNCLRDSQSAS